MTAGDMSSLSGAPAAPTAAAPASAAAPGLNPWQEFMRTPLVRGVESATAPVTQWLERGRSSPAGKAIQDIAQIPGEALGAVLLAPRRAVQGVIGTLGQGDVNPADIVGHAAYSVFHPSDPTDEQRSEQAVHLDRIMMTGNSPLAKFERFVVQQAYGAAIDPLTYLGIGEFGLGAKVLEGWGKYTSNVLRDFEPVDVADKGTLDLVKTAVHTITHSPNQAWRETLYRMTSNADLKAKGYSPETIAAFNSAWNKGTEADRVQADADRTMTSWTDRDWFKGKSGLDLQNEQADFEARPPVDEKGVPEGGQHMQSLTMQRMAREGKLPTGGVQWPANILERMGGEVPTAKTLGGMVKKLADARKVNPTEISARDVVDALLKDDRDKVFEANVSGVMNNVRSQLPDADKLTDKEIERLSKPEPSTEQNWLTALSKTQVGALLAMGFPHLRNIAVLGYLALGEGGMARALGYLAKPDKELEGRFLEGTMGGGTAAVRYRGGGISDYGWLDKVERLPVFRQFRNMTTAMLQRWENAVRSARLYQLDREMPNPNNLAEIESQKLNRLNEDIGAYTVRPKMVQFMEAHGANFPQWHGYIVPTTVTRAIFRHPERVNRIISAEIGFNDQMDPNPQHRWTFAGPVDEAASAYMDPVRAISGQWPSYFGGQSILGPLSFLRPTNQPPGSRFFQAAAGLIPFGSTGYDVWRNLQPPVRVPALPSFAAGLLGAYPEKRNIMELRRLAKTRHYYGAPAEVPTATAPAATAAPAAGDMGSL